MKARQRGFTILEVMVAAALTALLVTMCVRMLTSSAAQRRGAERRSVALEEAANVAESVAALPWDELTSERVGQIQLSESARQALGNGSLKVSLEPAASGPASKQIRVQLTWPNPAGGEATVELSSWAFAPGKGAS